MLVRGLDGKAAEAVDEVVRDAAAGAAVPVCGDDLEGRTVGVRGGFDENGKRGRTGGGGE